MMCFARRRARSKRASRPQRQKPSAKRCRGTRSPAQQLGGADGRGGARGRSAPADRENPDEISPKRSPPFVKGAHVAGYDADVTRPDTMGHGSVRRPSSWWRPFNSTWARSPRWPRGEGKKNARCHVDAYLKRAPREGRPTRHSETRNWPARLAVDGQPPLQVYRGLTVGLGTIQSPEPPSAGRLLGGTSRPARTTSRLRNLQDNMVTSLDQRGQRAAHVRDRSTKSIPVDRRSANAAPHFRSVRQREDGMYFEPQASVGTSGRKQTELVNLLWAKRSRSREERNGVARHSSLQGQLGSPKNRR